MEYKRLKENLQILDTHNHGHGKVISLTGGQKTETVLIDEIVSDCRQILRKIENGTLIEAPKHKYVVAESNITGGKFVCKLFPQALYSEGQNAWTFLYDTFTFSTILYEFDTKEEAEKCLRGLQG